MNLWMSCCPYPCSISGRYILGDVAGSSGLIGMIQNIKFPCINWQCTSKIPRQMDVNNKSRRKCHSSG